MANVNKVLLIGRLTRDVESRSFNNGGKVAKFGFAVSNRKKNSQTGQWEDVPMFIDCEVYNRGEFGKQADLAEQYLAKGKQVFLEGRLELDQWDDKTSGQKRSKHKMVVESMQFLEAKDGGEGGQRGSMGRAPARSGPADGGGYNGGSGEYDAGSPAETGTNEEIPF
ncbi:MAG: single-stranded DNA-binding protein [Gemmataceae bacterium]